MKFESFTTLSAPLFGCFKVRNHVLKMYHKRYFLSILPRHGTGRLSGESGDNPEIGRSLDLFQEPSSEHTEGSIFTA